MNVKNVALAVGRKNFFTRGEMTKYLKNPKINDKNYSIIFHIVDFYYRGRFAECLKKNF